MPVFETFEAKKVKYVTKSICPCGEGFLKDEIPLGTEYTIFPGTLRNNFTFICGKCGWVHDNIEVVDALSHDGSGPPQPLPAALFDNMPKPN